jgi:hypothetical protein
MVQDCVSSRSADAIAACHPFLENEGDVITAVAMRPDHHAWIPFCIQWIVARILFQPLFTRFNDRIPILWRRKTCHR